ncbi:transcriptional regulator [Anaerocolumna cellulosilytica]|uniref:Transcriptional regulator n=1 Tax=Anaerocolumna cellulosilytica TaxID=433286 RepID=A0A6S6R1F3_9FIRM|nr:GyrI-like domain-containing protein [Anaerocolumna cellulosilytica]MBB5195374.1 hypothetical protein [Anaerocolumna cellulosilytica]BCJ95906.1 transcriptional regulator [Anaerocolumna cellulosilytica]
MVKLDYKKEYKDLYQPGTKPVLIQVPLMQFIMVDGMGNPNVPNGDYQQAVELLYTLSYAIKMSAKKGMEPAGYFEYVVPPLEGLWWLDDTKDMDFSQKDKYNWTSMLRQPEFVTEEVFNWACNEVREKKPHLPIKKARFQVMEEGLCVQCMHIGSFDSEAETITKIDEFVQVQKLNEDIGTVCPDGMTRRHHEIYLQDFRKVNIEKIKTILRHPVRFQ